jgi:hypothetical protein
LETLKRNTITDFDVVVNSGALTTNIVWFVSDTSIARVDAATGVVTALNRIGTVILTAMDTDSGLFATIILRIT